MGVGGGEGVGGVVFSGDRGGVISLLLLPGHSPPSLLKLNVLW